MGKDSKEAALARLIKVDLRKMWKNEQRDFTPWLAEAENLDLLGAEIGVPISFIEREAGVGRYKVDILAEEQGTERKIIIENCLGETDHDHLGKIITYASGYDAEYVIWIVKDAKEEHQKAMDWINEHTSEEINFFLIKIELWQIDDSKPAPKFDVLVKPNEWSKVMKSRTTDGNLTDTKLQQLSFWTGFRKYYSDREPHARLQMAHPQHWYDMSIGSSDAHLSFTALAQRHTVSCELYISENKELFEFLQNKKAEVEQKIGSKLEWIDAPVASRIKATKDMSSSVFREEVLEEEYQWLFETSKRFKKVFSGYLSSFKKVQ